MGNLRNSVRRTFGLAVAIPVLTTGVLLETSWGASWIEINRGLPSAGVGVNALTIDPSSPSTIYAQTTSSLQVASTGLFKTTDGGGSWKAVSSVAGVTGLAVDPKNSSTLYAGTDQGVIKSTNGGASWSDASSGLANASVRTLIIDPITPSTLYALGFSAGPVPIPSGPVGPNAGVFKSTNGGGSWRALDTGLPPNTFISLLVLAPATPSTLYVVTPPVGPPPGGGPPVSVVLKSTDGGESWKALNAGLPPNTFINSLTVDPITSSTIYALTNGGVLKSTDEGESWKALNSGLPPNTFINILAIDPTAPSTIYAAGSTFAPTGGPPVPVILKSTDGAENWNVFKIGIPSNTSINSLALDPLTPSRIYVGFIGIPVGPFFGPPSAASTVSGGVFKSTDGGESWNSASAGLVTFDVRTVAMSAVDASTVYSGGFGGVFKSTEGGANWKGAGLSAYTGFLVAGFINPNIVYAQTGSFSGCNSSQGLLLKTTDGGANWSDSSPLNSGCILNVNFPSAHAAPMVIDPANLNTLYLGESDDQDGYSALLKSTDGGANWLAAWDSFTGLRSGVRAVAINPAHSATLYAGLDDESANQAVAGGLFKSTDGGTSWSNTGLTKSAVNLLAIDPSNPNIIYAGTEGHFSEPKGFQGLFKSADGGTSWMAINIGLAGLIGTRFNSATALILEPASSNILYLGTSNAGVFRSVDGGANWSPFNDGLANLQIRALVAAPGTSHTVYAGTPGGVFKIFGE